jgi:hypothetical protein
LIWNESIYNFKNANSKSLTPGLPFRARRDEYTALSELGYSIFTSLKIDIFVFPGVVLKGQTRA